MAQLTIQFLGICTHFNNKTDLGFPLPVPHRVVFTQTDAATISVGTDSYTFQLHPELQLPDNVTIPLTGQRMFIAGTTKLQPPDLASGCIPHLKTIWPGMELSLAAVLDGASPAAAYFDIFGGDVSGFNHTSSAAGLLTLDLDSPAMLVIESFDGLTRKEIPIDLPQTILIENHPIPGVDISDTPGQEAELQLNFLVATQFPPPPLASMDQQLLNIVECLKNQPKEKDAGPGCSNSQYP